MSATPSSAPVSGPPISPTSISPTSISPTSTGLSESELSLLDFERGWASRVGAKEAAILAEFGLPAARYYQMLYVLIDSPAALRHDPLLVRRLQRLRDTRTRSRAARSFRPDSQDTTY